MKVPTSWLDFKLSLRMLVKYPFVSLVAAVATAFTIGVSAIYFEVVTDLIHPELPLEEGDRVVEVRNVDLTASRREPRSLHDYVAWREQLTTVRDLAAFTTSSRNLAAAGEAPAPHDVVEIGAAAFRVARISPLQGRGLVDADEQEGAPPVAVIGERLWESRFDRDPTIVGRPIEVGSQMHTVVGIMPESFALPVNQDLWIPLQASALDFPRREGPAIGTIGRLAPGATLDEAQAELDVLGARLASEYPESNERLRPRVSPYLEQYTPDPSESTVRLGLNGIFMMLLAITCANVGALVFARIVTREREFSVRTALGASRRRIVTQLFVEALMLTGIGALAALAAVGWGLRRGGEFLSTTHGTVPPFWQDSSLNLSTILYVAALAVLGAVVMGVLPALKFTRGSVEASLRRSAAGGSGMKSRKMSTAIIVAQVALASALLPIATTGALQLNWSEPEYPGIRPGEYLAVRYRMEEPAQAGTQEAVKQRALAEPGFSAATFAHQLPGSTHFRQPVEVSAPGGGVEPGRHSVRVAAVDADYFETFETPILAGRGFHASDLESDQGVVVVNQPFVRQVLGGRNAVGRRVRFPTATGDEPDRWYEIVGVVPDLGMNPLNPEKSTGLYRLAGPAELSAGMMAIHVEGGAGGAAERFRTLAADVDENFLVYDVRPLDQVVDTELQMDRAFALLVIGGTFFLVLLSAAVTFALMSFTVSQRRREIGIYKALGASSGRVLRAVFSRALLQLGLGAGIGALASVFLFTRSPGSSLDPAAMAAVVGVMLLVGLVSCGAPALRALRIQPILAMKDD